MGDQVYTLKDGENIPVEPTGDLLAAGWLPGTWVKWSANSLTFSGAVGTVERSDGTGTLAGFLRTGPQHNQPIELLSDMWTTDTRQRAGGDNHADWGALDASMRFDVDANLQLQRMGSRVATLFVPPTGYHKFYVFETADSGDVPLTYVPGDPLYVSSGGLLTKEQETPAHPWTGYVVARSDSDAEGNFIAVVAAMA